MLASGPIAGGGLTTTDSSTDDTSSSSDDDYEVTSTSDSDGSYADFRQAESDSGLHDEGYAGAIDTQDNDADAVVDEGEEVVDIAEQSTESVEDVAETFEDTQPRDAVDDIAPDAAPTTTTTDDDSASSMAGMDWVDDLLGDLSDRQRAAAAVLVAGGVVVGTD